MTVAIDATPLTVSSGGIRRYVEELSHALAAEFPEDQFVLLSDQPFEWEPGSSSNLRKGGAPRHRLERRWWLWGASREMTRQRADVFHGTDFSVPYVPFCPSLLTLHDLSPWMDRGWHAGAARIRRRTPWLIGMRLPSLILTPSETVRRQAIDYFRLPSSRVVSVPLAADSRFQPCPESGADPPYFLFVGTLEPRKNLAMLVEAWTEVRKTHAVDLVLAGRRRRDGPEFAPRPGLRLLGEVPDESLPRLYSNAVALVYPSLYEGFGLPVLEAMQCGAAVIASRDPAIREVAGDAAILLDARDPAQWVAALTAALTHPEWFEDVRQNGLRRVREFSWARTARATREAYDEAMRRF